MNFQLINSCLLDSFGQLQKELFCECPYPHSEMSENNRKLKPWEVLFEQKTFETSQKFSGEGGGGNLHMSQYGDVPLFWVLFGGCSRIFGFLGTFLGYFRIFGYHFW